MSYRNTFLNATDVPAYNTAIRNKVDGTSELISGMKAGGADNTLQITGAAPEETFDISQP